MKLKSSFSAAWKWVNFSNQHDRKCTTQRRFPITMHTSIPKNNTPSYHLPLSLNQSCVLNAWRWMDSEAYGEKVSEEGTSGTRNRQFSDFLHGQSVSGFPYCAFLWLHNLHPRTTDAVNRGVDRRGLS